NLRAVGVAGWSRTMSLHEMDKELLPAFQRLKELKPSFVHYKTCSTCDSSPNIGSIGRAMELGKQVFGDDWIPILIAAPHLGRYQAFGNLFARSGLDSEPYRLDRHPTMRCHPITPMQEADIREHLQLQTPLSMGLCDCLQIDQQDTADFHASSDAILFDAIYQRHLPSIGRIVQSTSQLEAPRFLIGSSGVESALITAWEETGRLEQMRSHAPGRPQFGAVEQLLVVTGSCSPVNDRQIGWAEQNGFDTIALRPDVLVHPDTSSVEIESIVQQALTILENGANLILHTARGPADPRVKSTAAALRELGFDELSVRLHSGRLLGPKLGSILGKVLMKHSLTRVGIAGGDTSGYVARQLGIEALEAIAPVAPGSPLCRVSSQNTFNGMEIIFKGGQVGRDDVWGTMLRGNVADGPRNLWCIEPKDFAERR
ncbi:MAG: four-carbon acid sugar kinase family protein, partial [Planctomycetales bacterium]|nr:four-carbon acid sugar kinase family protein [Planctomycetales bacterium]